MSEFFSIFQGVPGELKEVVKKILPCCSSEFVGILEVLHLRVFGHEKMTLFQQK
ncbi:hypothetical protein TVAG_087390 [Trichomonas vaginalis G3]|uniref:Uncharacterized protein n=1 Tax=Trichomonas vaginalis (strain ATCC PRA-98 / G3) TaxID=412133 RepID=A2H1I2_TRIV3|nr:hypothetical protein TVAG_087390 [Trichomonas vaginalis G3]|eukprot:XP_001289665.1 hypothetical protein [Trichomonas vaginalis G3]